MEVIKITNQNLEELRELYNAFTTVAQTDFLFELPPIPFDDIKANFQEGFIKAYICKNPTPEAFMLYSDNLTQGLEITLIYSKDKTNNEVKTAVLEKFLIDAKTEYPGKVISYPMLGIQNLFTKDIIKLGFSPVNEKILELQFSKFNNSNEISLPQNYTFAPWNNIYSEKATQTIFEEFSKTNDVKFDPRFNDLAGTKNVLNCIIKGYYGEFLPNATIVLLYNNEPVGYCFVNLTSNEIANIPLLVLNKEHQGKGLGKLMLNNSVCKTQNAFLNGEIKANLINTTCDAQNISALKTYLNVGFQEKTSYFHAYMNL